MRKGFTLIELLIVVTIIAILAGAAIPYVQEYVEDARISRCKADLTEIKNALIRYELDKGAAWPTADTTITNLVGPYLGKAIIDPWGSAYVINEPSSIVYSPGPNRTSTITDSDNISVQFRPPLAMTKAFWIDADNSGGVTSGDQFSVRFTRPITTAGAGLVAASFQIAGIALGTYSGDSISGRSLQFAMSPASVFVPGRDELKCVAAVGIFADKAVTPYGPNACLQNVVTIQALQ